MSRRSFALLVAFFFVAGPAFGITRSWTGAISGVWSDGGNWSPAGVPVPEDQLIFPAGATRTVMTNDLATGTRVGAMTFQASYTLDGNALTVTAPWTMNGGTLFCNADLTIDASVSLGQGRYKGIRVNGVSVTLPQYTAFQSSLEGTGTITAAGPIELSGSGSFSGTIRGEVVDYTGTLPNAAFIGSLQGRGSVGDVTTSSSGYSNLLAAGASASRDCCISRIGTLHTRSIVANSDTFIDADLVPGGTSDLLQVTGSVTLSGARLRPTVLSGVPAQGESFLIIDNDGSDAISGTFLNLPEGATVAIGPYLATITYRGGTGNDVVLTINVSVRTWTGASSAAWSNPANWSPNGVPSSGEALVFSANAARTVMTNDLGSRLRAGQMTFQTSYTLNGNPLTVTKPWVMNAGPVFCNTDLTIDASVSFGLGRFKGAIQMNGVTLNLTAYSAFEGSIDGSGTITSPQIIEISATGSFSGTIHGAGVDYTGVLPNASFVGPMFGIGTIGDVTTARAESWNVLSAGSNAAKACCIARVGTLHTRSIVVNSDASVDVDLVPGGVSDLIQVSGSVRINGAGFNPTVIASSPGPGESFTIIDNDGTDAVTGTFQNLPEGALVSLGTATATITYRGGTGNDIVLNTVTSSKAWTGANSGQWSDPGNWSPPGAPTSGQALVFPAGVVRTDMNNDLPAGLRVGAVRFEALYTLNGNALTLTDSWLANAGTLVCNTDLTLDASLALGRGQYGGVISVNGHTLTLPAPTTITGSLRGSGTIKILQFLRTSAAGSFTGTIQGELMDYTGSLPNASFVGSLQGSGKIGAVTIAPAASENLLAPGSSAQRDCCIGRIGTLQTKSIVMQGPSSFQIDLDPGNASDLLQVEGTVRLDAPQLAIAVVRGSPLAGQTFTILDNDGSDAIDGTFAGLAENAVIVQGPWKYRITYHGGDGNDVVLTAIDETVTASTQNVSSTRVGEAVTFTATVTSRTVVPTGSVAFKDNGTLLQTIPLVNGTATLSHAVTTPGTHEITTNYTGTAAFEASSASIVHEVLRGNTETHLAAASASIVYGDPSGVAVEVTPVAPASGIPAGKVAFRVNGAAIDATLKEGKATVAETLDAGTHTFSAQYYGDTRFDGSESLETVSVVVVKAQTRTRAIVQNDHAPAGAPITIDVEVDPSNRPALAVPGEVTVSVADVVLVRKQIARGSASIVLSNLPVGDHELVIAYGGSGNFEPSRTTVSLSIANPELSARDRVIPEGDSGETSVSVAVKLSARTSNPVSVFFSTADGTARDGEDYRGVSGTLTFAAGELERNIEVPIYGDWNAEPDEEFRILLSAPSNATLAQSSVAVRIANDDDSYRKTADLVYATVSERDLTLDMYTPIEPRGLSPLIVWIPGTNTYDATGDVTPFLGMTLKGYSVAEVRYRPAQVAPFPAQLDDLQSAIRWLRTNASRFNVDPQRIVAWGSGAGGHLASLLGTSAEPAGIAPSSRVQGVVAFGAASDLPHLQNDGSTSSCAVDFDDAHSAQSVLIGCALSTCTDKANNASPLSLVDSGDAPFLLIHGAKDCGVPVAQSKRLYDALRAAGVKATLQILDDQGAPETWPASSTIDQASPFLDALVKTSGRRRAAGH